MPKKVPQYAAVRVSPTSHNLGFNVIVLDVSRRSPLVRLIGRWKRRVDPAADLTVFRVPAGVVYGMLCRDALALLPPDDPDTGVLGRAHLDRTYDTVVPLSAAGRVTFHDLAAAFLLGDRTGPIRDLTMQVLFCRTDGGDADVTFRVMRAGEIGYRPVFQISRALALSALVA